MSLPPYVSKVACDGKIFLLEVTGGKHDSALHIEFYDETDMTQLTALEAKQEPNPAFPDKVRYTWDWREENAPRNIWLAIESDQDLIKVPLYEGVSAVERQFEEQDYQVKAFVPMAIIPGLREQTEPFHPAHLFAGAVRGGYLYIARNNKIWREIEISITEDGEFCFKDVHLYAYRKGRDKPFTDKEHRKATGVPLKEIWYPAREKGQPTDIRMAYSEVPWSAARLNYLEANPGELALRMKDYSGVPDWTNCKGSTALRPREVQKESLLAEPEVFNRDISGKSLNQTYQTIKAAFEEQETLTIIEEYQYGTACAILAEKLSNTEDVSEPLNTEEGWLAEPAANLLEDAQQRQLSFLIFDDPIQQVRHLQGTLQYAINYYQQLQLEAEKHPHFNSALLVNAVILPETLKLYERKACRKDIAFLQQQLLKELTDKRFATVLRDISSMDDANGLGGHILLNQCLLSLVFSPEETDSLLPEAERKRTEENFTLLTELHTLLSREHGHPLSQVLFPSEPATLTSTYTPPEASNDGSGFLQLAHIANWSEENINLPLESVMQQEALTLALNSEREYKVDFAQIRRIWSAMDNVVSGLYANLLTVQKAISEETMTISFKTLYTDTVAFTKALAGDSLKEMTFSPVTGKPMSGYAIGMSTLDADSPEVKNSPRQYLYGNKAKKNSFGNIAINQQEKVFNTNKAKFNKAARLTRLQDVKIGFLPDTSDAAAIIKSGHYSDLYIKAYFPVWMTMFEVINLRNAVSSRDPSKPWYSIANITSALLDISTASIKAHNLITANSGNLASWSDKPLRIISDKAVIPINDAISRVLKVNIKITGSVTRLTGIGVLGGLITAGIAAWDCWKLAAKGDDDAAVAMGMVATGAAMSALSAIIVQGVASGLWTNPVFLIGLALAVVGMALVYYFTDTPIEQWLKMGPFTADFHEHDDYRYLTSNPEAAFHQLLSLFTSLTAETIPVDELPFDEQRRYELKQQGITHAVHIRSHLPQLMNLNETEIRLFGEQVVELYEIKYPGAPTSSYYPSQGPQTRYRRTIHSRVRRAPLQIYAEYPSAEGWYYLFKTTLKAPKPFTHYFKEHLYQTNVRIRMQLRAGDFIFPQPPIDKYEEAQAQIADRTLSTDSPDFDKPSQYYWEDSLSQQRYDDDYKH